MFAMVAHCGRNFLVIYLSLRRGSFVDFRGFNEDNEPRLAHAYSEVPMETRCTDERRQLLERFTHPVPTGELIELLSRVGVTRAMVQRATGAKSTEVVNNWASRRSTPRAEHFERLDSLRVVVSFLLQTNALDDEGLAIAMWLNSYPASDPFVDENGRPVMTPLQAIRAGEIHSVVDAAQRWVDLRRSRGSSEAGNAGSWSAA
jgi:hypothetical protein